MKKFKDKLLLLFLCLFFTSETIAQISFQKTFGGTGTDGGRSLQQTTDGGFIIAGFTNSFGAGVSDVYLIKANENGDTLWTKSYGGIANDQGYSVQQTSDGGYIITGIVYSFGAGGWDVYLIKTNTTGDIVWNKTFGGPDFDCGRSVDQTSDEGYIITGYTKSFGAGNNDVYLIRTDSLGDTLWTKTFGGALNDYGYSVQQTNDLGYIVAGKTYSFGAGSSDVYLIKTDANGNTIWTKSFGGTLPDAGNSVQQTSDGGYIITGETFSFGAGSYDVYLIKTNINGDLLWSKTYGESDGIDIGDFVRQTTDGGYIITGQTTSFGATTAEVLLLKVDSTGNTVWSPEPLKIFGSASNNDYGVSVQQTSDGGYIITGQTQSFGAGGSDVYLIKINADGDSSNSCGTNGVVPVVTSPSTVVNSTATIVGSGATVTNPATIVSNTVTIDSVLCFSSCNLFISITDSINVSCNGGNDGSATVTPSGGTPPYTYSWSSGHTDSSAIGLPAGTYTVVVTDTNCCTAIDSILITEPSPILVQITGDTIICNGDTTTLTASGGIAYLWNTGDTTVAITVNPSDTTVYAVTVSDSGGCFGTDSFTIIVNPIPNISIAADTTICNGDSTILIASGCISYFWNTGDTTASIMVNPTITTSYSVSVSDSVCSALDSVTVTVDSLPIVNLTGDTSICKGDTATLIANVGISYLWNTADTTISITVNPDSTTTYTVVVFNGNCYGIDSITVAVLNIDTTFNIDICTGDSILAGGSHQTTSGTYYDTLPTANTCDSVIITNLNVLPYLVTNIDTGICAGDSILAGGSQQTTSGTYYDTLPTANICDSVIITNLNVLPYLVTNIDTGICAGDSILAGGSFQTTSGTYPDTLIASGGCDSIIITQLIVNNLPVVDAGMDVTINADSCVALNTSGGGTYIWNPPSGLSCTNCQNPIACPAQTTTWYLTVIDGNGCLSIDSVTIMVIPVEEIACSDKIFIPNAFSPNGDGENDVFRIISDDIKTIYFAVYNRWGEKVFETGDVKKATKIGWDGKHNGEQQGMAVFVYYLEAICIDNNEIVVKKGDITLIR